MFVSQINQHVLKQKNNSTLYTGECYKNKVKTYWLKCRKNTENLNSKVSKTSNDRTMVLSKCEICGSEKSRLIKNQEGKGISSNLGIRTPLTKVPVLGYVLF